MNPLCKLSFPILLELFAQLIQCSPDLVRFLVAFFRFGVFNGQKASRDFSSEQTETACAG